MALQSKLEQIAEQAGRQNQCRIYDIYRHRDRLQIFIDKPSSSVRLSDCENVFHSLRFLLKSSLPDILERKRLEVSSPGIEKPLRALWHFKESLGRQIKLLTHSPIEATNTKTGKTEFYQTLSAQLISIVDQKLSLKNSRISCYIPLDKVKSAKCLLEKPNKNFKKTNKEN